MLFFFLICLVSFCFKVLYQWFKQNDSFTLKTTGQKGESAVYWTIVRAEAVLIGSDLSDISSFPICFVVPQDVAVTTAESGRS